MKYKKITINENEYRIKKLPLGEYVEMLDALDMLPEHLGKLDEVSEEKVISALPAILKDAFPEMIEIISLGSGIDEETLKEEAGLTDIAEIVSAIWEINEFKRLGKVIRGLRQPEKKADNG